MHKVASFDHRNIKTKGGSNNPRTIEVIQTNVAAISVSTMNKNKKRTLFDPHQKDVQILYRFGASILEKKYTFACDMKCTTV